MSTLHCSLLASLALGLSSLGFTQQPVWNTEIPLSGSALTRALVPLDGGGALAAVSTTSSSEWTFTRLDGQGATVLQTGVTTTWNQSGLSGVSDQAGGAYFLGSESDGTIGGPSLGGLDAVLVRVDANGQELWSQRIGGSELDQGYRILFEAGELVIVGRTASPNFGTPASSTPGTDGFLARLDPADGTVLWVARHRAYDDSTSFSGVARTPQGEWLVTGTSIDYQVNFTAFTAHYGSSGLLLSLDVNGFYTSFSSITPNGSGYVVVAVSGFGSTECVGFDAFGLEQFSVDFPTGGSSTVWSLVSVSPDLFVLGGEVTQQTSQGSTAVRALRAFDSTGTVLWDLLIPDPQETRSEINYLAVDADGSLFAGGRVGFDPSVPGSQYDAWIGRIAIDPFGAPGCAAQPNSTGSAASTIALGSDLRVDNRVTLGTSSLPTGQFGYFLASLTPDFVPGPGGSQGDLCLGGSIGRFTRAGEILLSGNDGLFSLVLDLGDIPAPTGSVSAAAGQTWHFQSWYRDMNPGATSNFSSSVLVTLN